MKIKLLKNIPLSNAVVGGRTAWQSFHRGGNYPFATENITEEDYNFLDRLFNKYKHISVAEHIWYSFLIEPVNTFDRLLMSYVKNEYNFFSENEKGQFIFSVNLRTILEELKGKYTGNREVRAFYINLCNYLPELHKRLIMAEKFKEINIDEDYALHNFGKVFTNELGHSVQKIFEYEINDKMSFERRPHKFTALKISGFSRALLQEKVRHDDLLAITGKSTRYTLKELKNEEPFIKGFGLFKKYDIGRAKKYIVIVPGMELAFTHSQIEELEILRKELVKGISNDKAKFLLPESYRTEIFVTYNQLNIENLIKLRTDKSALWEYQELAKLINNAYEEF